jgi:hypothetical protein
MALVYRKTDKGSAEIATRANRLAPRLRNALIVVDGRRRDDELRQLIAQAPDEALATLLAEGYIEVAGTARGPAEAPAAAAAAPAATRSAAPAASTSTSAPASASASARNWEERRRQAVRYLNDKLGPTAESLVMKIEKTRDWNELRPHLEMAAEFLRAARGTAAASEFAAKFVEGPVP